MPVGRREEHDCEPAFLPDVRLGPRRDRGHAEERLGHCGEQQRHPHRHQSQLNRHRRPGVHRQDLRRLGVVARQGPDVPNEVPLHEVHCRRVHVRDLDRAVHDLGWLNSHQSHHWLQHQRLLRRQPAELASVQEEKVALRGLVVVPGRWQQRC